VVIPEDKEVELKDNMDVQIFEENGKFIFTCKPKQGQWDSAFIAFPMNQASKVNAAFSNTKSGVMHGRLIGTTSFDFHDGKGDIECKLFICYGDPATRHLGYKITCDSFPTVVVFGDFHRPSANYTMRIGKE